MQKDYTQPKFELVSHDKHSNVFFAASGEPSSPSVGGSLGSMTNTNAEW